MTSSTCNRNPCGLFKKSLDLDICAWVFQMMAMQLRQLGIARLTSGEIFYITVPLYQNWVIAIAVAAALRGAFGIDSQCVKASASLYVQSSIQCGDYRQYRQLLCSHC